MRTTTGISLLLAGSLIATQAEAQVGHVAPTEPAAAHDVDGLMARFIRALNDESIRFLTPFLASDAVLVGSGGEVLSGRESILQDFFRPVVARIRGLRPGFSRTFGDDRIATVVTTYTARLAPATEPGHGVFTTTWRRQPDDSWLIVAGTFELPRYDAPLSEQPIRSGSFHSDGVRLHYVDFGGDGVPLVFVHSGDRTGYTFMEFAPRFTDRNRVLAISQRGAGLSGGDPANVVSRAILARDIITMLDSLALERAVVAGQWEDLLIHLAAEYPDRMAGLVFLESHGPSEPAESLQEQDPIGVLQMLELNRAAFWGGVPERPQPEMRHGSRIDVPALSFVTEAAWPDDMWDEILGLAGFAERSAALFPDPRIRAYFQQLATDEAMQEQGRVFWRDIVSPSLRAHRDAVERAFGDRLRLVPVEPRAIGYGYRDTPEVIAPHIRRFLDEVRAREEAITGAAKGTP
jgi:pimeloyl-ACP methyl ester carboxylesterase